ncbi:hypothetical protein BpHYR1_009717 [Brachionus plicatilis]|uniref:Uncharacterized protein n=1 Tax=Brachionus plicatilis TaxID=10195 RepID=A0A3M7PW10_BRAPC|nr:hypothetical protein BpHYR1_009717 [Brachionus plicatilis]
MFCALSHDLDIDRPTKFHTKESLKIFKQMRKNEFFQKQLLDMSCQWKNKVIQYKCCGRFEYPSSGARRRFTITHQTKTN